MADANGIEQEEWALWRAFLAVQNHLSLEIDRQLTRDSGIALGEYGVLAAILEAPGRAIRIGPLAEQLGWERSRVSHLVGRMEKRGLVTRRSCDDDGRATEVLLTQEGRRTILGAIRGHGRMVRERFLDRIEPADRAAVARAFERILSDRDPDRATPMRGEVRIGRAAAGA